MGMDQPQAAQPSTGSSYMPKRGYEDSGEAADDNRLNFS